MPLTALEKSKGGLGVRMYLDLMNTGDGALAEAAGLLPYLPNNAVSDLVATLNQLYANGQKPDFNDPSVRAAVLAACQADQGDKAVQSIVKSNQAQSSKNMLHAQIAGEDAGCRQACSGMMAAKEATARAQSALNQSQAHLAQAQAALDTALDNGSPAEAVIQAAQAYRAALTAYDQAQALAQQSQKDLQQMESRYNQAEQRVNSLVEGAYRRAVTEKQAWQGGPGPAAVSEISQDQEDLRQSAETLDGEVETAVEEITLANDGEAGLQEPSGNDTMETRAAQGTGPKPQLAPELYTGEIYTGDAWTMDYTPTSGIKLTTTPGKTTTILGRFNNDTGAIIQELGIPKGVDFEKNMGGFNLLNSPDELYQTPDQFWNEYNKAFIDAAISRGDVFLMATPISKGTLYDIDTGKLTGYGREYFYLIDHGYHYVDGRMIKEERN